MSSFEDIINEWCENTESSIDDILKSVTMLIGNSVVVLSPVDTGRFKGNWQLSINSGTSSSLLRQDPDGFITLGAMSRVANTFTAGQVAYIQNHVLYGYDLEYGSSRQAVDGMVRVTEAKFIRLLEQAVQMHT